jgi:hypothetical protein
VSQTGGKSSPWLQTTNTSTRWEGTLQYKIYSLWGLRLTEDSGLPGSFGLCDFCAHCVHRTADYIAFTAVTNHTMPPPHNSSRKLHSFGMLHSADW